MDHHLDTVVWGGQTYSKLTLPGGVTASLPGHPTVPSVGALLGIPFGITADLQILAATYEEVNQVLLMPSPEHDGRRITHEQNPTVYSEDTWLPEVSAQLGRTGQLRDQRVQAITLNPLQYNPARRTLRYATKLRVRLAFAQSATRPAIRAARAESQFNTTYRSSLLNAESAARWRGRTQGLSKQVTTWYDPTSDWYRIPIEADGVYRIDSAWFEASGISPASIDPTTLQVYAEGAEIPLLVEDGGDGTFDVDDRLTFWATYRRTEDRNWESRFGRLRTYWLRFGRESGLRFRTEDGLPSGAEVETPWVMRTVHSEIDSVYERWGDAPDVDRDHWLYKRTASPSSAGAQEFTVPVDVPLLDLATGVDAESTVRVGMHGLSLRPEIDPDHRTIVEVQDGILVAEDRWDGQVAFTASGQVSALQLSDTTRVTLRTPGAPEYPFEPVPYVDHVRLNWITISYPASTVADSGRYVFDKTDTTGAAYTIGGFAGVPSLAIDVTNGLVFTGFGGSTGQARLAASTPGRIVVVDDSAILTPPVATLDSPSELRANTTGAEYVIVTHGQFVAQSEMLAEHRATLGLTTMVVDVQDVYDEFNFGDVSEVSIRDFMQYAYDNWSQRPVYLLLMGRMSYDYRDKMDQFKNLRRPLVPAMPFQSVRRGQAFTDHLYGTVAGDDPFMDIWVGRYSVNTTREAETVVAKAMGYDNSPDEVWRDRVLYMANWDDLAGPDLFIKDSDELVSSFAEPLGLSAHRVYHDAQTPPEPNESSNEVIRQFNEGRLIANFMGHGSAASMSKYIAGTFQQRGFNYTAQISNFDRLPLVVAMSCLNGLFDEPTLVCFAEEMLTKRDGGAIGFVSASSLAFIFVNNEVNQALFKYMMREGVPEFGAALALAKTDLLAAMPGIDNGVFMMNLMGDPAQRLAIPAGTDYALSADDIRITSSGDVLSTADTAWVRVRIRNDGIQEGSSIPYVVVRRGIDDGQTDTLTTSSIPAFGSLDSTAVLWPLADQSGRHEIEVILDPGQLLPEIDRNNDRASVEVEVFGRLSAVPSFPIESQRVSASVKLGVRTGLLSDDVIFGDFELSPNKDFSGTSVMRSGRLQATHGLTTWVPGNLADGVWFWRARMSDSAEEGAWTSPRSFTVGGARVPRAVTWSQGATEAIEQASGVGVTVYSDGSIGRSLEPLPIRLTADFREETITAIGAPATAILATDGTHHYVKGFFSLPAIYPDSDSFLKVGTGLNGTTAGENLGPISDPSIPTVSAAYHGDGFVYSDNRKAKEIVQISPSTGETNIIPVEAGLLEVRAGLVFDGHSLFTSDGEFVYNVANGINGIPRSGWTVRVFKPEDEWSVVREFTVDPTSTGFSFSFTDGVIADGKYLYLVEFGTGANHRVRVVDAVDGSFVEEYQSDQAETDLLSGQYDWVNNKVWMGQLSGNQIHRYRGRRLPDEGLLTSAPIGPSSAWQSLTVNVSSGSGLARVDLLGETAEGAFLPISEWSDLPAGDIDLTELDSSIDRIQVRARLAGPELAESASLEAWSVTYLPVSDVAIAELEVGGQDVEELDLVLLAVAATNRGPIDITLGSVIAFYAGDPESGGRLIGRQAIPEATEIGVPTRIEFAWITAQFAGTHRVHARVEDLFGNAAFFRSSLVAEDVIEISPSSDSDLPSIDIEALDAAGEIRSGDYLPSQATFQITIRDSSGIDRSSVELALASLDGPSPVAGVGSNLVSDVTETPTGMTFQYAPPMFEDGTHSLEVRAIDRIGNGPATKTIQFEVTSDLRLENVLTYPNPMADQTHFTFLLTRPSDVTIRIYTIAGRLIRVIEDPLGRAGYNQIHWDGLDAQGRTLANGAYIYTVSADDGVEIVKKKETLIVYR